MTSVQRVVAQYFGRQRQLRSGASLTAPYAASRRTPCRRPHCLSFATEGPLLLQRRPASTAGSSGSPATTENGDAPGGTSLLGELLQRRAATPSPVLRATAWRAAASSTDAPPGSGRDEPVVGRQGRGGQDSRSGVDVDGSGGYVPLLCRQDFMGTWRRPHAPLPLPPTAPPPPTDRTHETAPVQETKAPAAATSITTNNMAEWAVDEALPLAEAAPAANAEAAGSPPADAETDDAAPARFSVSRVGLSSTIILDPVQWLAESCDAPLMTPALLAEHVDARIPWETDTAASEPATHHGSESQARDEVPRPTATATGSGSGKKDDPTTVAPPAESREGRRPSSSRSAAPPTAPTTRLDGDGAADARLVYNPFTSRIVRETSAPMRLLAVAGMAVDAATREVRVTDRDALEQFAAKLRAGEVSWPALWSSAPSYGRLRRLLTDSRIRDPATHVERLLEAQFSRLRSRPRAGEVATGAGSEAAAEEGVDDKLLSLADLNEEQRRVIELVLQGHHTYIGGSAGTGKSVLLRVLRRQLLEEQLWVAVTGTTGVAAAHIGGCTLHHRFGITLDGEFTRWKELRLLDVLIIDEVSMLPCDIFEALDRHLRRVKGVELPFGGVQIVLSGDFMQLGAVAARPIVNSPLFRRNFVMLQLKTAVRQASHPRFVQQLQQLRRGHVPPDLHKTVALHRRPHTAVEGDGSLQERQQAQLRAALGTDEAERVLQLQTATPSTALTLSEDGTSYVEGAVNLLPTNREVHRANARELARLEGESIVLPAQVLPPALAGLWSPTYLLRIVTPGRLQLHRLQLDLHPFLERLVKAARKAGDGVRYPTTREEAPQVKQPLRLEDTTLYLLFVDALALRVRLPRDFTGAEEAIFSALLSKELDPFIETLDAGVRVREVLPTADGLQTEQDEYALDQYASHCHAVEPLTLKVGAKVMLRVNLEQGLVNGSIGTVVGFAALSADNFNFDYTGRADKKGVVQSYADFLQYEHSFESPVAPIVDFGDGRVQMVAPALFRVGGHANTHHYSVDIHAFPLSLAYAFTVHKVQGLTLVGRVHLELTRMWPCEHLLYVAMSRVRNPEQLSVANFTDELVTVAADCLLFDSSLPPVERAAVKETFVPATWRRAPHRRKAELERRRLERAARRRRAKGQSRRQEERRRLDAAIRGIQQTMLDERSK